jgi:hypothetical protein
MSHRASRTFRWHDGDTMLSFALFAQIILGLPAVRITDPANWIMLADAASGLGTCEPKAEH